MERLEQLIAELEDFDLASAAADALEAEAVEAWIPRLREVLKKHEDGFIRETVARPLARLLGIEALPDMIAAVQLGFEEGFDCDSVQGCMFDLIDEAPERTVGILKGFAKSERSADRQCAAWLLDFAKSAESFEVLKHLSGDHDDGVAKAALSSITFYDTAEARQFLKNLSWSKRFRFRHVLKKR